MHTDSCHRFKARPFWKAPTPEDFTPQQKFTQIPKVEKLPLSSSFVSRHLTLVTRLVLESKFIILAAFLLGEGLELLGDNLGNITEASLGVLLLHGRTVRVGVDEEGALVALRCVGILLLLLTALAVVVTVITRRFVVLHLPFVPFLVLFGEIFPLLLLLFGKSLVLLRENFGLEYKKCFEQCIRVRGRFFLKSG